MITCSSTENSAKPTPPSSFPTYEARTLAESIKDNPDTAENYRWIKESRHDEIWMIADEFPNVIGGLRPFYMDLIRTLLLDPDKSCQTYNGERVIYQFVVNKEGIIDGIKLTSGEKSSCSELIKTKVEAINFTPGTVDGEPVAVLYDIPIVIQI